MGNNKVKSYPKPTAVRKTVVDFCKKNKMSVRQFNNNAKRTRMASTKEILTLETHLRLWKNYGWL